MGERSPVILAGRTAGTSLVPDLSFGAHRFRADGSELSLSLW